MAEILDRQPTALDAVVVESILNEHRIGRDPLITYETAPVILKALGRGEWSSASVRDLVISTWTLHNKNTAPLSRFLDAADDFINRRRDRPNLKQRAIAVARAARQTPGKRAG